MRAALWLSITLLSACTETVVVPAVAVDVPGNHIPGRYAASIETSQWMLRAGASGLVCAEWSFDIDVDEPFSIAMRKALERTLERVTFVPETLSAEQLEADGYDAQIVIRQGEAAASFSGDERLVHRHIRGDVVFSVIVAVHDRSGLVREDRITRRGMDAKNVFVCPGVAEALQGATRDALQGLIREGALTVRASLSPVRGAGADK